MGISDKDNIQQGKAKKKQKQAKKANSARL